MIKAHEYVPSTEESFAVMENTPGRLTVCHAIRTDRATIFEMDASLFLRIAGAFLEQRTKDGTSPTSAGSRKARTPKSELVDL